MKISHKNLSAYLNYDASNAADFVRQKRQLDANNNDIMYTTPYLFLNISICISISISQVLNIFSNFINMFHVVSKVIANTFFYFFDSK